MNAHIYSQKPISTIRICASIKISLYTVSNPVLVVTFNNVLEDLWHTPLASEGLSECDVEAGVWLCDGIIGLVVLRA